MIQFSTKHWARNQLVISLFVEGILILLHLRLAHHENRTVRVVGQAFDFTRELSLPTLWSVLLAFGVSATALMVFLVKGDRKSKRRYAWLAAAIIFSVIAIDDGVGFHERLGAITSLDLMDQLSYRSYPWHITVAPIMGAGLLIVLVLLIKDIRKISGLLPMMFLATGCFAAAFGLDYIEGLHQMAADLQNASVLVVTSEENVIFLMVAEEILEMAGTAMFLYVFLSYFCSQVKTVELK